VNNSPNSAAGTCGFNNNTFGRFLSWNMTKRQAGFIGAMLRSFSLLALLANKDLFG
jgi:hypothetical protein